MLKKAHFSIAKDLDLVKFLHRMRLISFAVLTSLNSRQQFVARKMSTMLIRESSDLDDTSVDYFELDQQNQFDTQKHT